jgi:glutamate/tyrosine decarboxylase-like PLP-dependent enzyme
MAHAPVNFDEPVLTPEDEALIDDLGSAVESLLPALEAFLRFDQPERTALQRAVWSAQLDEPLPQAGAGADAVIATLRDVVIPNGLQVGAPGFSGWVATIPTVIPTVTHLASTLAGPLCVGVQAFNLLEAVGLRWLGDLIELPSNYKGIFTPGGSVANLIGLGAARQHAAEQRGLDPARDGVAGLVKPRIYASTEVHHCVHRAAAVLGLGRQALVLIPTDDTLRVDPGALRQQLQRDLAEGCTPLAVVATAGTTSTGAIDPLPELSALCREFGIWLHIDGAYGLLGVLDPEIASLYGDLDAADSLVVGPSKWLATCAGYGSVFVRDGSLLERTFTLEDAVYLEDSQPIYATDTPVTSQFDDFGYVFHHFGVEHSLPSRGVEVWAVMKEIGVDGVRARVRRHNHYARYLAERVRQSPALELAAPVTLSTCCFRYVPEALQRQPDPAVTELLNQLNRAVLGRVRARGRCAPSATMIQNTFVIRPCFINARTTLVDVDALLDEVELCGAAAWAALCEGHSNDFSLSSQGRIG